MAQQESDQERFDQRESMKGYRMGLLGEQCPNNASLWLRIGWKNGRVDYETLLKLADKPEENFNSQG